MISLQQWELGVVKVPDDEFIPIESFTATQIIQMIAGNEANGKIIRYEGIETGAILSPDFCDVLERD